MLDCVLLKDSNWTYVAGLEPEIYFRAWHSGDTRAMFTLKCSTLFGTVPLF